ncbi:sarcosine oxidase subunit gamma [Aquisediminimonas profunda]|uniref:sarcosine oxidase subunit gamma n=1 Tax=Aquisediminimonas profunda TaxID=1550733 RepID=UPI001C629F0C|nr:sarcosine oxidase subunit gamma family protein [Aquisediminimonas profunda]
MADALTRLDPVPAAPVRHGDLTIALAQPMRRWSLRARDAKRLEELLGVKIPGRIGETLGEIACLGPDEWLWRSAAGEPRDLGSGLPVSIVDISERSVGLVLEGASAREVLNAGCPLDLERFAVGRTVRTIYEGVEIILSRETETRWTVDVWRSFAEWLWLSLTKAAEHP